MSFTAKDVQKLREMTGCGMMDCKKALTESEGDMDKAVEILRERGLSKAVKKAGRVAAEGLVSAVVKGDVGCVVEVNSETDFVAKNDSFRDFVAMCADVVIEKNPADVEALLACDVDGRTVDDHLKDKIMTIGENIKIRRFCRMEGVLVPYIHAGGTHAVLVRFETSADVASKPEFTAYGKDVAMQIAAINPTYLSKESVPADAVEEEKKVVLALIANDPASASKPDAVKEKMAVGRLGKFYKEVCLLEQPFVKDDKMSVAQYTQSTAKQLGGEIKVAEFVRYEKGEGIEKRQDDFASEVASMVK